MCYSCSVSLLTVCVCEVYYQNKQLATNTSAYHTSGNECKQIHDELSQVRRYTSNNVNTIYTPERHIC